MNRYLPVLGAFITIAALAIDPITQAMIEHKGCLLPIEPWRTDVAEVSRTNYYLGSYTNPTDNLTGLGADNSMEMAIDRGLHYPQETADLVNFKCATGNCTFQQGTEGSSWFSSLAMCYSCKNITDQVISEMVPGTGDDNRTWWLPPLTPQIVPGTEAEDEDLPLVATNTPKTARVNAWGKTPKISTTSHPWLNFERDKSFYSFDILMLTDPGCEACWSTDANNMAVALRCSLDACVKDYHAKVQNGVYSEAEDGQPPRILKKAFAGPDTPLKYFGSPGWAFVTNTSLIDGQERQCVATENWEPRSVRVDFIDDQLLTIDQIDFKSNESRPNSKFYRQECVWAIDSMTWFALSFSLDRFLVADGKGTFNDMIDLVEGPMWLRRMFASASGNMSTVETVVRGLANAMTAAIRNKPYGENDRRATVPNLQPGLNRSRGTISSMQTCVYVHWGWIAYPIALLGLQWIFSILLLIRRSSSTFEGERERLAWKSSPLALLFHGLDDKLRMKHSRINTLKKMKGVAEDVNVYLAPFDDTKRKSWRFFET